MRATVATAGTIPRGRARGLFITALAALSVLAPAAVRGSPDASGSRESEAHISRGLELRRSGDDRGALPEFEKAYEIAHTPRAAAQLGLVEQALGRWSDADAHLGEAIRARDDPWIEKNRAALQKALHLVGDHVGTVEITGEPSGAEVIVNGRSVGRLPLPDVVQVIAGTVDVEVRATGYGRHAQKLSVGAHQHTPLVVRLEPLAPRTDATAAAVGSGASATTEPAARAPAPEPPSGEAPTSRSVRPIIGWTLASVGAATAVAGVLVALAGQSAMDGAVADAERANQANDRGQYDAASARFSSGSSQRTAGRMILAAGAVAAVGGAILALTAPSAADGDRQEPPTAARTSGVRAWLGWMEGPPALGASFAAVWP